MSAVKKPEVWIIRHKETKEMWTSKSGKSSWKQIGHAKSAWRLNGWCGHQCKFDEQNEYEVFNAYNYTELEEELGQYKTECTILWDALRLECGWSEGQIHKYVEERLNEFYFKTTRASKLF